MFVPDPGYKFFHPEFRIPDPGSQIQKKKGTGSRIRIRNKECKNFNPKHGHMIRDGYPGFRIFSIPDPGVQKALDPGPWIQIFNTVRNIPIFLLA
jgi:hypothetical protein